jgi:predicted nucleic acid-binding protein
MILERKVKELERVGKTKDVHRTNLGNAKARIANENLPLPTDTFDHKFIEAAVACGARYIITTDPSLLVLDPYDHDAVHLRIVEPSRYVLENCNLCDSTLVQ